MSFGYSVGDFVIVTQLAYSTVQNARKACGAHSALAREVNSLHVVLVRLESEVLRPESILSAVEGSTDSDGREEKRKELEGLVRDCERVLKILASILNKYNALPDDQRSVKKLWHKVRFGNGEMQDLGKIRSELATYTQAIALFLNLLGFGSQGKVERYMERHGAELREIKARLNWVTAKLQVKEISTHGESSILSSYVGDDKEVWKIFRRELIQDGFSSKVLGKHKETIKSYVMELGARGVLDDDVPQDVRKGEGGHTKVQNMNGLCGGNVANELIEREGLPELDHEEDSKGSLEDFAATIPTATGREASEVHLTPLQKPVYSAMDSPLEEDSSNGEDNSIIECDTISEIREEEATQSQKNGIHGVDVSRTDRTLVDDIASRVTEQQEKTDSDLDLDSSNEDNSPELFGGDSSRLDIGRKERARLRTRFQSSSTPVAASRHTVGGFMGIGEDMAVPVSQKYITGTLLGAAAGAAFAYAMVRSESPSRVNSTYIEPPREIRPRYARFQKTSLLTSSAGVGPKQDLDWDVAPRVISDTLRHGKPYHPDRRPSSAIRGSNLEIDEYEPPSEYRRSENTTFEKSGEELDQRSGHLPLRSTEMARDKLDSRSHMEHSPLHTRNTIPKRVNHSSMEGRKRKSDKLRINLRSSASSNSSRNQFTTKTAQHIIIPPKLAPRSSYSTIATQDRGDFVNDGGADKRGRPDTSTTRAVAASDDSDDQHYRYSAPVDGIEGFQGFEYNDSQAESASQHGPFKQESTTVPARRTSLPLYQAFIEEVEDVDFIPGTHPNCWTETNQEMDSQEEDSVPIVSLKPARSRSSPEHTYPQSSSRKSKLPPPSSPASSDSEVADDEGMQRSSHRRPRIRRVKYTVLRDDPLNMVGRDNLSNLYSDCQVQNRSEYLDANLTDPAPSKWEFNRFWEQKQGNGYYGVDLSTDSVKTLKQGQLPRSRQERIQIKSTGAVWGSASEESEDEEWEQRQDQIHRWREQMGRKLDRDGNEDPRKVYSSSYYKTHTINSLGPVFSPREGTNLSVDGSYNWGW